MSKARRCHFQDGTFLKPQSHIQVEGVVSFLGPQTSLCYNPVSILPLPAQHLLSSSAEFSPYHVSPPIIPYYWNFPRMVPWLRIYLSMQGTPVWSLVQEDPKYYRATKLRHHNYWACIQQLLKAVHPRACAPQEKPPHWETHMPRKGSPTCYN